MVTGNCQTCLFGAITKDGASGLQVGRYREREGTKKNQIAQIVFVVAFNLF